MMDRAKNCRYSPRRSEGPAVTAPDPFSAACGQLRPLHLAIEHADGGRVAAGDLDQPFALIGSADGCDITLTHPDVPERVACLQVLDGVAFVVTLTDFAVFRLTPESPFAVGPFVLRIFESPTDSTPDASGDPLRDSISGRQLPAVRLRVRDGSPPRELAHRWTFLGDPTGERFAHPLAYVVLTPAGPFAVDLLSAVGTRVNGNLARAARLIDGDELAVGQESFTVAVGRSDPAWLGTPAPGSVTGALLGGPLSDDEHEAEEVVTLLPTPVSDPPPAVTDTALAAVLQKLGGFQSLLLDHFRRKVDDMLADFGNLRREQLVALRDELARLSDGKPDSHSPGHANGVATLPPQPVGLPALVPSDEVPVSDETAAVHQAMFDRLQSLDQERHGLWKRLRGLLGG